MSSTVYESFSVFGTKPKYIDKVYDAKELLGTHKVYSVRFDATGNKTIVFEKHFLACVTIALNKNFTAQMGIAELKFWNAYDKYKVDMEDGTRDDVDTSTLTDKEKELELAYSTLSIWIADEIAGNVTKVVNNYVTDYEVN